MKEIIFKKSDYIKVIAELASYIDSLDDEKTYILQAKEQKRRRSLDANAYAWVLLDKLAEKLRISKTEIYKQYIKEIGGVSETVCVQNKAVDKLCEAWECKGTGWQTERIQSKINGCTNVVLYYGSSVYDSEQMSRLIELIVQDCKEYGIPTLEDIEIQRLAEAWG